MFAFKPGYFGLTILLLAIEILIALFVNDGFVRPYLGDVLVVMLIYCFLRAFFRINSRAAALGTLAFAFLVEAFQAVNLVEILGWQNSRLAVTLLGNSFAWLDILAYIAGFLLIIVVERAVSRNRVR